MTCYKTSAQASKFSIVVFFTSSRTGYNFFFGSTCCFLFLAISQSSQSSEREGEQSTQPSGREGEQSTQPSDQEAEKSKYPSKQRGKQSKQQSERKGEQFKQPIEPEAPDDLFSLLAEIQELRKLTGLESQTKEHYGEQAKQPTTWEGEQSKQQSEHQTANDMFSMLAEIQELTKTAIECKRQKTEDETLKKMIEDTKQMNTQIQPLIKKSSSESKK